MTVIKLAFDSVFEYESARLETTTKTDKANKAKI